LNTFGGWDDLSWKSISILLLGFSLVALLWLAFKPTPVKTSALVGKVTTAGGQAVVQAEVTALHVKGSVSVSALTDAAGEYRLLYLPAGSYSLEIRKMGFIPFKKLIMNLEARQTVSTNAVLAAAKRQN
jgi:hypothetical protein